MGTLLCRISESEFIEFSEVENHDDFYSVEEGRVHVQDQRGYYIMYDSAINDLEWVTQMCIGYISLCISPLICMLWCISIFTGLLRKTYCWWLLTTLRRTESFVPFQLLDKRPQVANYSNPQQEILTFRPMVIRKLTALLLFLIFGRMKQLSWNAKRRSVPDFVCTWRMICNVGIPLMRHSVSICSFLTVIWKPIITSLIVMKSASWLRLSPISSINDLAMTFRHPTSSGATDSSASASGPRLSSWSQSLTNKWVQCSKYQFPIEATSWESLYTCKDQL